MQWDENWSDANGEFTESGSVVPGYGSESYSYGLEAESAEYAEQDQTDGESAQCDPSEDAGYEGPILDYGPGRVVEQPETVNVDSSQQYGQPYVSSEPDAADITTSTDNIPSPEPVDTYTGQPGGVDLPIQPDSGGAGAPSNPINPYTGQPGGVDLPIQPDSGGAGAPSNPTNPYTGQPGGVDLPIQPDSSGAGTPSNPTNPYTGQPGGVDLPIASPGGALGPAAPLFIPQIMNDPNGARIVNEIQNSWDRANQALTVPDGFKYGPR
ncbi:hypothetical protein [Arthrobacter sp. W4I7]|uniref:hypothetical protein n=1 Tax=Arthrobacter sp. W4I7 TaxID=3042296 RepID=UPI002785B432|nr:hypothetical protein [Arthrobacter sp. W4I7]MDQ0693192.1 hypothetical protein [Arthrobacter sp. W4I7]